MDGLDRPSILLEGTLYSTETRVKPVHDENGGNGPVHSLFVIFVHFSFSMINAQLKIDAGMRG